MIKILELFAGIHASSKALKNLGYEVETTAIEFDKKVVEVSNILNDRNDIPIDIRDFKGEQNKYDLVVAGFPCQPFSNAGKKQGFNDEKGRGDLYKETLRVVKEAMPKNVIFENVKGILSQKHIWIVEEIEQQLQEMGYKTHRQVINAKNYIAQNRERVFIIGSLDKQPSVIPTPKPRTTILKDYLDKIVDESFYLYNVEKYIEKERYIVFPRKSDGLIIDGMNNRALKKSASHSGSLVSRIPLKIIENYSRIRNITPTEAYRLMGWDDKSIDKIKHLPKSKLYFTAGNSMVVQVMEAIFKELI